MFFSYQVALWIVVILAHVKPVYTTETRVDEHV